MLDQNIDIKAKAIYAYLCSYAGTGYEAFPSLSDSVSCLGISIKTYYKYIHILMDDKYITTKNRTKNGMRASTIYILSTDPMQDKTIDEKQILKNQDTEISKNQDTEISKNQDTEIGKNQDTEIGKNQDTEIGKNQDMTIGKNQDTNNNREKNNTVNIKINPSNNTKSKNIVTRDGEMDDDAKRELTNSIIDQLYNDYVIPDLHKKNKNYITAAIHYLTNYDNRMIFLKDLVNTYENESKSYQIYVDTQLESFRLFVKALIELLLLHSEIILNKRAVTAYEVSEMLNEFIEQEKSSFNIQTLQETAIDDYQIASCEVEIRNHVKYMQACIWNVMLQGKTSKVNDTNMDLKADIAKRTKQ
ncbi:MAG: helix-turn-helix domain-containing protein [Oscillospiraceae bacterium]|nr:helix-turn-helix domain-containing protein [Oscillospiraceae bacterium]